jgi:hypothetical protein
MNWEKIESEYKKWVSENPAERMFSYRAFIDWLKQNYKHIKTERDEQQKTLSSITENKRS